MNRHCSMLLLAGLVAACRREAPPTTSAPVGAYTVGVNGTQTLSVHGVNIETSADLPDRSSNVRVDINGDGQTVFVLRGWPINLTGGRVQVMGRDYGPVKAGDTVRLAKDGVHVGTELRGPLP